MNNVVDVPRELMPHIQSGALSLDARTEEEAKRKAKILGLKNPLLGLPEAFDEVRARLRDGWTVTERMCPITNFPLMKKGETMWSIRAQMPTMVGKPSETGNPSEARGEVSASSESKAGSSVRREDKMRGEDSSSGAAGAHQHASTTLEKDTNSQLLPLKEAYEEMSKRLLQGWTMLNETCPVSDFPLLRSRDGTTVWSVRCQCEVKIERRSTLQDARDGGVPSSSNSQKHDSASTIHKAVKDGENGHSSFADIDESELIPARPLQSHTVHIRRERQSALISEKLLQGWKMLSEACPQTEECPLMEEPGTGRKWSAATERFVDQGNTSGESPQRASRASFSPAPVSPARSAESDTSEVETRIGSDYPAPESPVLQAQGLWRPPTAAEQREIDERQKRSDEWSRQMSRMMLQGWKMLDLHCPVTGEVPLMEEPRTGRKYSVATGSFVLEEDSNPEDLETPSSSQAARTDESESKGGEQRQALPAVASSSASSTSSTSTSNRISVPAPPPLALVHRESIPARQPSKRYINISRKTEELKSSERQSPTPSSFLSGDTSTSERNGPESRETSEALGASVSRAVAALRGKIDDASRQLQHMGMSDPLQCKELADMIASCAKGIKALRDI